MTLAAERLFDDQPPPCTVLLAAPAGWLAAPGPAAYHGLLGEIVRKLRPRPTRSRSSPSC